ncbi:uncharacterized protein [Rutidosis leptorrhynchoides]|uniref:uncharacterized protein n=1 Tax=Rutidosis leptorrhynchoides TaxID=125765 RepID=UPI003A9A058C
MGIKMVNKCFDMSPYSIPPYSPCCSSSSSQTLASVIALQSVKWQIGVHQSAIFGLKLKNSESSRKHFTINRAVSASLNAESSDEEFSNKIQELALKFQVSDDMEIEENYDVVDWPGDMIPASIERKANSVDLPFSLRIIKKKKQWQEGLILATESAYCSVKKAFSSMVFIIRELQSYTLQMREVLFYEDLQEVLVRVQKEMNASFVWLFQQVFSQTPTLMIYVMILLANYSVHSMSNNFVFASTTPPMVSIHESSSVFDSTTINKYTTSTSNNGKTTSIGGNNGGGGKSPAVASGTDGDGSLGSMILNSTISGQEEEWNGVVSEADRRMGLDEIGLDHEVMKTFVAPVKVEIEEQDMQDYYKTELVYQTGLLQEPDNPLLLANYAQFLYLVARDYDRADDYFRRASKIEPKDAEALNKYASFLWQIRNDLWTAEETYLEAISADPNNSFYAANYAHFLWNTGGEDTCFPLDSEETGDFV